MKQIVAIGRVALSPAILLLCAGLLAACAGSRVVEGPSLSGSSSDGVLDAPVGVEPVAPAARPRYEVAELPAVFGAASDGGCGLPCETGCSQWHVRGVFGQGFFAGDDNGSDCTYFGFDIGSTMGDSCWSFDAFYRAHGGRFNREVTSGVAGGSTTTRGKDGGNFSHVGLKLAFQSSMGNSNIYWWFGIGPDYFWTDDYIDDDEGFGLYAELGLGFNISRNWRIRAGINVHGMDTDVTRIRPVDDGMARWMWAFAPVIQIEASF